MNPKPFDSLNHFTVPEATLYSLRTGAPRPDSPPSQDDRPGHVGRAPTRCSARVQKTPQDSSPAAMVCVSTLLTTVRLLPAEMIGNRARFVKLNFRRQAGPKKCPLLPGNTPNPPLLTVVLQRLPELPLSLVDEFDRLDAVASKVVRPGLEARLGSREVLLRRADFGVPLRSPCGRDQPERQTQHEHRGSEKCDSPR